MPCPKKPSFKNIGLFQLFGGKQNQSVLQGWVRQSVKRIVILTKSLQFEISQEYQHDLSINNINMFTLAELSCLDYQTKFPSCHFNGVPLALHNLYSSGEFESPKSLNITKFLCKCSYVFRFVVRYNHSTCFQAEIPSN